MCQDTITFQLATHYLPKVALKIESLYQMMLDACVETHPTIHHCVLKNILEIMKLIGKPEFKSRFLKELIHILHVLPKSELKLSDSIFKTLSNQIQILTHEEGCFGETLLNNPFLQSILFSLPLHSMDMDAHTPQLYLWLESSSKLRQKDLKNWLESLEVLYSTVALYLSLVRNSSRFNCISMVNGYYQYQVSLKNTCPLILIKIDKSFGLIPKIYLGPNGFSLRLCEMNTMREIRGTDAKLELGLCQLGQ